jgi:hypothetical protein
MKFGFVLRGLSLIGHQKTPAVVTFRRGLNVIAGPSETGKSFIVQCIDYALGGGQTPQKISEVNGYSSILLELENNSDQRVYSLERSLQGGNVICKTYGQPDRILAEEHQAGKEDTVSQFLLNLSGLGTKKVRTNERGKTRPLSFRDIARLVIIDEETVIKRLSPVLSGQVIHKTVESGVFRLLLTGTDDSSIIAMEDPKVTKGRLAGKVELLEGLLESTRMRLAELGEIGSLSYERERLIQTQASFEIALAERNAALATVAPLQEKRSETWRSLRVVESKLAVISELQARFDLLQEQYKSDLRRLETIAEAGVRLDQLREERCPLCGALAEDHGHNHRERLLEPADVAHACKAEAAKTYKLLWDLQSTTYANALEIEHLQRTRDMRKHELDEISSELKLIMDQHVEVVSKKLDDIRTSAENCRMAIEHLERIQELDELLIEAKKPRKKNRLDVSDAGVSTAQANPFSKEVEALLRTWHFPALDRVAFSEADQDVVISGRARKSHGKGVRAIIRAAFNLSLLSLCIEEERPFPNFVLIDSPLLVYEEPDADESSFSPDVKKNFWESVKTSFTEAQVIIIENSRQLPDIRALDGVNVELFTGNNQGRRGFIPLKQENGVESFDHDTR